VIDKDDQGSGIQVIDESYLLHLSFSLKCWQMLSLFSLKAKQLLSRILSPDNILAESAGDDLVT
jgi:hypothetical protein